IDNQSDCCGRRNQRFLRNFEAEKRGRPDTALVADQTAKQSGKCSCSPRHSASKTHSSGHPGQARNTGEQKQATKDGRQNGTVGTQIKQSTQQATRRAQNAKVDKDSFIHLSPKTNQTDGCRNQLRNRANCKCKR